MFYWRVNTTLYRLPGFESSIAHNIIIRNTDSQHFSQTTTFFLSFSLKSPPSLPPGVVTNPPPPHRLLPPSFTSFTGGSKLLVILGFNGIYGSYSLLQFLLQTNLSFQFFQIPPPPPPPHLILTYSQTILLYSPTPLLPRSSYWLQLPTFISLIKI